MSLPPRSKTRTLALLLVAGSAFAAASPSSTPPACERADASCRQRLHDWFRTRGYVGAVISRRPSPKPAAPGPILVRGVVPGGPADRAGLRTDDVLVRWRRHPVLVRNDREALTLLYDAVPGEELRVAVTRDGRRLELTIVPAAPSDDVVRNRVESHLALFVAGEGERSGDARPLPQTPAP